MSDPSFLPIREDLRTLCRSCERLLASAEAAEQWETDNAIGSRRPQQTTRIGTGLLSCLVTSSVGSHAIAKDV